MIDCATPACSVALFEDEELISGTFEVLGRGHAERLVPMIADLPERGRASSIAVARGPGSFTGVRIGLAVARSLAFAWGATLQGYSTMALVAAMARQQAGAQGGSTTHGGQADAGHSGAAGDGQSDRRDNARQAGRDTGPGAGSGQPGSGPKSDGGIYA